jgi:hypothetical protein
MGLAAGSQLDVVDAGPRADAHAHVAVHVEQVALEARAVELERGVEGEVDGADLAHLHERAVPLGSVEEVAKPVLRKVVLVEIGGESLLDQIVRGDLDGRLADLPARARLLLEERDTELGKASAQLSREQAACQPAPDHRDVAGRLAVVGAHRIPPLTEITWPVT